MKYCFIYLFVLLCNFYAFGQQGGAITFYQNGTETDFQSLSTGITDVYITIDTQYYLNTAEIIYKNGQRDTINEQIIPLTGKDMCLKYTYDHQSNIQEFSCDFQMVRPWTGEHTRPFQEVRISGTDTSRIIFIYTVEDLAWFSDGRPHTKHEVYIMNDLDFNGIGETSQNWKPIFRKNPFYGSLYGRNKTISNLYIYDTVVLDNIEFENVITFNRASLTALIGRIGNTVEHTKIKDWHILNGKIIFENKHYYDSNDNYSLTRGIGSFIGLVGFEANNVELSNLTNGATLHEKDFMKNSYVFGRNTGLGGIAGSFIEKTYFLSLNIIVKNCINFGKIFSRNGKENFDIVCIGGIISNSETVSVLQNINWGTVFSNPDIPAFLSTFLITGGICASFTNFILYPIPYNSTGTVHNFSYGRIYPKYKEYSDYMISASIWSDFEHLEDVPFSNSTPLCNFSDSILLPDMALFSTIQYAPDTFLQYKSYKTNHTLSTYNLIDSAFMAEYLHDTNNEFILENGFYPRPRGVDERAGRLSSSPLILYPGDNVERVTRNFYTDTNYGVRWFSSAPDLLSIQGDSGILQPAYKNLQKDTTIEIEARLKGFHKNIFLTLHIDSACLVYDTQTICKNDSVRFFEQWIHEQGTYSHRVFSPTSLTPDTLYILTLFHNPTYLFEYFDTIAIKNLPYTFHGFNIDTIGTFIFSFKNIFGCDSIYILHISNRECTAPTGAGVDSVIPLCGQELEIHLFFGSTSAVPNHLTRYELHFNSTAFAQGFTDTTGVLNSNKITIPAPVYPYVNNYELYVRFIDTADCFSLWDTAAFEVRYPTAIIKQKWDDVLAVVSSANNGGYGFTAFQWYENDNILPEQTDYYLYQNPSLNEQSVYSILLTRQDGVVMFSCPVKPVVVSETVTVEILPNPQKSSEKGYVRIYGKNLKGDYTLSVYNESGAFVHKQQMLSGYNTLNISLKRGKYILQLHNGTETVKAEKLIVL
jgi:hypothetical protein